MSEPALVPPLLLPESSRERSPTRDPHSRIKHTDGWELAIEAALSQGADPLQLSSQSSSTLVEVAAQRQDVRLWRLLARACEEKCEYRKALEYATEALRVQPDDVASLSLLAQLHEKQHENEDAAHWHQRVLVYDPARKTSNRFLAHYYYSRNAYGQALPYFTQLLEADPKSRTTKLYYLLSRVKTSGVRDIEKLLTDMHRWRYLSQEEFTLAHELVVLIGKLYLESKQSERALQYLTWAIELMPTPEVQALLADTIARNEGEPEPAITGTVTPIAKTVMRQERYIAPCRIPDRRMLLRPIMATVGAAALTVALGLPLFLAQPPGLISQQESELVSSDESPRLSDRMPESVPTDQPHEPSLPIDVPSQQVTTPTLSSKAESQTKDLTPVSHPVNENPKPPPPSPFSTPKLTPKLKSRISESPQRSKVLENGQNVTPAEPVVTINTSAVTTNSAAPKRIQLKEEETKLSPSGSTQQSNPKEEPEDVSAMTAVAQQETETQASLRPTPEIAPESTESSSSVELAALTPSLPETQEIPKKMEATREIPSLSSSAEETRSAIPTLASQLPYATQFPTREREIALSPEQLWPKLKALVEQETEVLLREDKEHGILHGTIVQRQLRPRIHTFKPYGHYLVEIIPGTTEGTSLVRAKILTFDWRTKRPAPGAEQLADRFLQKIVGIIK